MRMALAVAMLVSGVSSAVAQSTPQQDALVAGYFAVWDTDSQVTLDNVAKLYGRGIIYYGHPMTREALYRDKLQFIRRWPERHYGIAPGSASVRCDASNNHCEIKATLVWRTSGAGGTNSGRSRISLALAREDGALKIVREGAVTLSR